MGAVRVLCGAKKERVVAKHKAPSACPRCGGAVVAVDMESERRILGLPLCVKSKRKYSCRLQQACRLQQEPSTSRSV